MANGQWQKGQKAVKIQEVEEIWGREPSRKEIEKVL
jgi:hypothetical protein